MAGNNCGWERGSGVVGSGYVAVGAVPVVGSAVVVVEEEEGEGVVGSAVAEVTAVEVKSHFAIGDTQVSIGRKIGLTAKRKRRKGRVKWDEAWSVDAWKKRGRKEKKRGKVGK